MSFIIGTRTFHEADPEKIEWDPTAIPPNPEEAGLWKSGSTLIVAHTEARSPGTVKVIVTSKQHLEISDIHQIALMFFPSGEHAIRIFHDKHIVIWGRLSEETTQVGEVEKDSESNPSLLIIPDRPRRPRPDPSHEKGGQGPYVSVEEGPGD